MAELAGVVEDQGRWGEMRVHSVEVPVPTEGGHFGDSFTTLVDAISWGVQ